MPGVIVSVEGVVVRRSSGKPRLLLRGRRRKACQKLLKALQVLVNQDEFEARRSTKLNYNPFLVLGDTRSGPRTAVSTLVNRLNEVLRAKS